MPEGHTLHRLARDHREWFAGDRLAVSSPQGKFAGAPRVDGRILEDVEAAGKHLLYVFGDDLVHVHLGLFGRFHHHDPPPPAPRDTVRMRLATSTKVADLIGATTCEVITPGGRDDLLERLGPDPLRDDADPEAGWEALQRRRVGIGRALMDQAVLSGVGNVYRAEVLFVHDLHPEVPAAEIDHETWLSIWKTLQAWMEEGVETRQIVTVDDPDAAGRRRYVYKQDDCVRCGTAIRRWDLAGRWAYACESCQPRHE